MQDEQNPSTKIKHSSVQFIAICPFIVYCYSETQLNILQDLQKKNTCFLYLDDRDVYSSRAQSAPLFAAKHAVPLKFPMCLADTAYVTVILIRTSGLTARLYKQLMSLKSIQLARQIA